MSTATVQYKQQPLSSAEASTQTVEQITQKLAIDPAQGLSVAEAKQRLEQYGYNRLQEATRRSAWELLIEQFKSPIIALLAVAAVLSFAFQEWVEGVAIIIAIFLNAIIGFVTELRAVRSMESLQEMSRTTAKIRRDGQVRELPAEELVPGDVVVFESGDLVPADLRLIEASGLQVDESALTGESVPVTKSVEALSGDLPLAERINTLFKGTPITRGSGEGIVVATGMETELGHISALTAGAKQEITPLEKRLDQLGRRLIWVTLVIAVLVAIAGVIGGKSLFLMVETAIALAVGAVPEGLPIVATVALARGMRRMANRNALINRLSAVETLGATSIICTDKTGTLTENQMTVTQILTAADTVEVSGEARDLRGQFTRSGEALDPTQHDLVRQTLEIGLLCNNASMTKTHQGRLDETIGDPMEVALLVLGAKAGLNRDDLRQQWPEVREIAFDADTTMMATVHERDSQYYIAVKGAPESVFAACSQVHTPDGIQPFAEAEHETWKQHNTRLAESGLRILAFAYKQVNDPEAEPYRDLVLVGVVGLLDPPRQDAKHAIKACHDAGVRVIMVTGDQVVTARNVGLAVGVISEQEAQAAPGKELKSLDTLSPDEQRRLQQISIFSRVSPEQKLNLISLHQKDGAIVAMTGDGVNDAPALKKADIGIAMGQRGTQVAREAADMVLQDDAFATIVTAIAEGRAIFRNIRKFTLYLLSGNVGEIIAVAAAALVNAPLPLLPLQILLLNAVNDVFPALALGVGKGNPNQMKQPPRPADEPVLAKRHWGLIIGYGLLIAIPVLAVFAWALTRLGLEESRAVTISFLSLAFGRLWHVFNMRDERSNLWRNEITTNPYIWGALVLCSGLLLTTVYVPGLASVLQLVPPTSQEWGLIICVSLVPLVLGQFWMLLKSLRRRMKRTHAQPT